jgi:hypothetical protein
VDVVRHETVGPQLEFVPGAAYSQPLEVARSIGIIEEGQRSVVTTVNNVQRKAGQDDTRESAHTEEDGFAAQFLPDSAARQAEKEN